MINEYTKLPYIGKKRAKKLENAGLTIEEIAKMDEITLKKYMPRVSHAKLKIIIATARDIVSRIYDITATLKLDKEMAKILALNDYDIEKIAHSKKEDLSKLLNISNEEAFELIFNASLKTGAGKVKIHIKKENIDRTGIISKEGFVNGFTNVKIEKKIGIRILPILIVAVLIVSSIAVAVYITNPALKIDGNFREWNSIGGYSMGNFTYKYSYTDGSVYFYIHKESMFSINESFYVAIDDGMNGYWMEGIHAQYVAEFYGWNGTLRGAYLWKHASGTELWNFTKTTGLTYAYRGDNIEGMISNIPKTSKLIFIEKTNGNTVYHSGEIFADKPTVQVVEKNLKNVIENGAAVFKLNISSPIQFRVSSIEFNITGANLISGKIEVGTKEYYTYNQSGNVTFNVNTDIHNTQITLYGNFSGAPKSVVNITAILHSNQVKFSYIYEKAKMYLFSPPSHIKIDGAFGDWNSKQMIPDTIMDVNDANIDLVNYSRTQNLGDVFMEVRGEFMGGTDIPVARGWNFRSNHTQIFNGTPPPLMPKNGNDTAEIYIGSGNTGAHLYWVPFPVTYRIVITGRDGMFHAYMYKYEGGSWDNLGVLKNIAAGYHRVELATGLNIPDGKMWITVFNWEHEEDMPSFTGRSTRAVSVTDTFYLHGKYYGYNFHNMNCTEGSNEVTDNLTNNNGAVRNWYYEHSVTENFNISSAIFTLWYSDKYEGYFTPSIDLNVSLYAYNLGTSESTLLAYSGENSITQGDTSIHEINITIGTILNYTVIKGDYIKLSINYTGGSWASGIEIYYNSTSYHSLLNITTNTTMKIKSVWTENSTGAVVDNFTKSNTVYIYTNITDPLGYQQIAGANVSVFDPLGNVVLSNSSMSISSESSGYIIFYFDFTLSGVNTASGVYAYTGKYPVSITAKDCYGFTATNNTQSFYVNSNLTIAPSRTLFVPSGPFKAWYLEKIFNNGDGDDIVNFKIDPNNPPHFNIMIYRDVNGNGIIDSSDVLYAIYNTTQANWTYIKNDTDNNNEPDMTVMYGHNRANHNPVKIIIQENLSLNSSNPKETFNFIISSQIGEIPTSPQPQDNVWDTAILRTVKTKTLYLKGDGTTDSLNSFAPTGTTDISINNPGGTWESWVMNTSFANNFVLAGNITIKVYIEDNPGQPNSVTNNITLKLEDGTYIGSVVFQTPDLSKAWYTLSISPSIPLIPRGSKINMSWYADSSRNLHFNSTLYPSQIILNTTSYINVWSLKLYNVTSDKEQYSYKSGDSMNITALVREPFIAEDIKNVWVNVTSPNGTTSSYNMTRNRSISDTNWYQDYYYVYQIPSNAFVGNYTVTVTAEESNGVENYSSRHFTIASNISITPHTNSSTGTVIWYNHTIWNYGDGYDIITINIWSNTTANVTLYFYNNGNLEVMAYSNSGTGWSSVNSSFEYNSTQPGYLIGPENSFRIIIKVNLTATSSTYVNTTVNITDLASLHDSASDLKHPIPELNYISFLIIIPLAAMIITRKKKRNK